MVVVEVVLTALIIAGALACLGYLRHVRRFIRTPRLPWISVVLFAVTAVVTALQYRFPSLLGGLRRDLAGLLAGQLWRLVTPLFVQPQGAWQIVPNALLMLAFVPLAERLYRARILIIYFTAGVLTQCIVYAWSPNGGGSSSALFGVIGALCGYVLRHRRVAASLVVPIACVPVIAAAGLALFFRANGHGPGLLIGALVSSVLKAAPFPQVDAAGADAS